MEMQKIYLWENEKDVPLFDAGIGQEMPSITPFLLNDGKGHGAIIVAPGGAYTHKAAHEGAPVAQRLNEMGINAFVLDYRVHPYHAPVPMLDAQRAIRTLGGRVQRIYEYPIADTTHRVVIIEKVTPTPKQYPRAFAKIK